MGILARHPGATVSKARYGEPVGGVDCRLTPEGRAAPILAGLSGTFRALVGRKEAVQDLPPGAVRLAVSGPCPIQMIRAGRNVHATQFHPAADGTSFATRNAIYRRRRYFPPHEAAALTARALAQDVTEPFEILRNFITRYVQAR